MNISIPNRASDAGPDVQTQDPAPDWRDLLFYASDEVLDCIRIAHDERDIELKLRQASIDRAMEYLRDARAALPGATKCRR